MRTSTNPAFYADELRLALAEEPDRLQRALRDPDSVDLLTWNVFSSLDTHGDRAYLAYRMQAFGGSAVRSPVRINMWSGKRRQPLLEPSRGYVHAVRERASSAGGTATATAALEAPIEVPVLVETPDVLVLVETMWDTYPTGAGGRDRIAELVDAGLEQARRLEKALAVAVVYRSGTPAAADVSARVNRLRDPAVIASEQHYRHAVPAVAFREVPWQQLTRVWEQEMPFLRLGGQPTRAFLQHLRARGLR